MIFFGLHHLVTAGTPNPASKITITGFAKFDYMWGFLFNLFPSVAESSTN